jgi:hypothetical protein
MTPTVLTRLPWGHRGSTVLARRRRIPVLVLVISTITQER